MILEIENVCIKYYVIPKSTVHCLSGWLKWFRRTNFVCSWRRGGSWGWGNFQYIAQYGCACRIAPFFSAARYMIGPLFLSKSIWMARFFWIPVWKAPFFLTSWYMHIFFAPRFFEAAYPLGITWIGCDICVITSKKWVQIVKGQYMNRSTFWMIKYMNGSVFSKARYMNGVGFEILARTPVPKLPLNYRGEIRPAL